MNNILQRNEPTEKLPLHLATQFHRMFEILKEVRVKVKLENSKFTKLKGGSEQIYIYLIKDV